MRDRSPIKLVHGNLIAARSLNDIWATYQIPLGSHAAEPQRRKAATVGRLEDWLRVVGADVQILRVNRRYDAGAHANRLRPLLPAGGHAELWDVELERQQEQIAGLGAWLPATFVAVRLAEPRRDLQGHAARLFDRTPMEAWRTFKDRVRATNRGGLDLDEITARERVAGQRVSDLLGGRAATAEQVQWLIRRRFTHGLGEPEIAPQEPAAHPFEEGERAVLRWLSEDGTTRHHRHLVAHSVLGNSFQIGLCLGSMGDVEPFSRQAELLFSAIEGFDFPVDACMNLRWVPNDQAVRKAARHMARAHHQLVDADSGEIAAGGDAIDAAQTARDLHDRLTASGEPLLVGTLSYLLGAPSLDEVKQQARTFREGFPHPVFVPLGSQREVWEQHLPAQRTLVRGFERPFTAEQVGNCACNATYEAGSKTDLAMYVGRTVHGRRPVLLDVTEASRSDRPPTIAIEASLGGGKSMMLQLLFRQAFLLGYPIADVDPKGDHLWMRLPEVAPHVREIELGPSPEHRGTLDPLRVAPDNERHDSAVSFLAAVLPRIAGREETLIHGAVGRVLDRHGVDACCMAVVGELERGADVERDVGEQLRQYCGHGVAQLGFASLDDPPLGRSAKQVVYLNVRALQSPGHLHVARSELSPAERHGMAMIELVALYAMKLMSDRPDVPKVIGFDEAYVLSEHAAGQRMLTRWARWGRSEFGIPILSTQNVQDLARYKNLLGIALLGAMQSREDAASALAARDLDPDGRLCRALCESYGRTEATKGQFLLCDLHGRNEEIRVDPGERLLAALSTTPGEGRRKPARDDASVNGSRPAMELVG